MRRISYRACFCILLLSSVSVYYNRRVAPSPTVSVVNETALTLGKKEIRLLTLHPGSRDDPMKCDLSVVQLDEFPIYEALSYTWGDPAVVVPILLHDTPFNITTNLYSALLHLRIAHSPRNL